MSRFDVNAPSSAFGALVAGDVLIFPFATARCVYRSFAFLFYLGADFPFHRCGFIKLHHFKGLQPEQWE
ncbi:Hypothetical protein NTJ_02706 [Nesidiocoris tenuis]|uniref:Uncharacterized protein n=1 Tax=Nesidiocoris tenuis TaxID=355587 RepID=A0ABN7AEW0_9HEMI|nr:Hypothetical protein NTJ_02706 [Nesidiocoris tenuis]